MECLFCDRPAETDSDLCASHEASYCCEDCDGFDPYSDHYDD